jgi:hypothetical protein
MGLNELIKKSRIPFEELGKYSNRLKIQLELRFLPSMENNLKDLEERFAVYDIHRLFDDYSYLINRILYHLDNYIKEIDILFDFVEKLNCQCQISFPENKMNIAFEFESFISSANKILEQPVIMDILSFLTPSLQKEFPSQLIKRENVDGFYWRMNILRNRVVHPDEPKYENRDNYAYRYYGFSSKPLPINITFENIMIQCTLIDLNDNPWIKKIIHDHIIIGKSKENIFDILQKEKSSKGHGKREPRMLFYGNNIKLFDYNRSFLSIAQDILKYIDCTNNILMKQALRGLNNSLIHRKCNVFMAKDICINDFYNL